MTENSEYLRALKALCYEAAIAAYQDRSGHLGIKVYEDATVTPVGQMPGASDRPETGLLIDDCDFCSRVESESKNIGDDVRHIGGTVLYAGYFRSQWGHFLLNSTSRLWPLFTGACGNVDHILFFYDSAAGTEPSGNYKEFLDLAGLSPKVIIADRTVRADRLIVPDISFEHTRSYSREATAVFEAVKKAALNGSVPQPDRNIMLTRSELPTAGKDEINIRLIDRLFTDNGFRTVSPEKISLTELIRLLASARTVASLSGSTAHNFIFADPRSEFITVERTAVNNYFQIGVNLMAGLKSTPVDAYRLPAIAPSTGRLFLYGFTDCLKRFAADRGWSIPDVSDNARQRKSELCKFLKRYRHHYGYTTGTEEWAAADMPAVAEACAESREYYRLWLERRKPLFLIDYFSLKCIVRMLKDRLKRQ